MFRPNRGGVYNPETDSELVDELTHLGQERDVAQARTLLAGQPSERDLRRLATKVFQTAETAETLWRDSFVEALAHRAGDDDLVRLIALWPTLSGERRAKVLVYASEQAELARSDGGSSRTSRPRGEVDNASR